jgi:hypothetical protein
MKFSNGLQKSMSDSNILLTDTQKVHKKRGRKKKDPNALAAAQISLDKSLPNLVTVETPQIAIKSKRELTTSCPDSIESTIEKVISSAVATQKGKRGRKPKNASLANSFSKIISDNVLVSADSLPSTSKKLKTEFNN